MELCWCHVGVVAVDDGGCSCVVLGVRVCLRAANVGDGGWGGCFLVVLFPVLGGGGVGE